jgi:hypothetical protein
MGDRDSIPCRGERIFPLASVSRPALGSTHAPVQWVPGDLFPGVKERPGRDADHSPRSTAEVENELELYLLSTQAPPWRVVRLLQLYACPDTYIKTLRKPSSQMFAVCPGSLHVNSKIPFSTRPHCPQEQKREKQLGTGRRNYNTQNCIRLHPHNEKNNQNNSPSKCDFSNKAIIIARTYFHYYAVCLPLAPGWFAVWTMAWWYWLRLTPNLSTRALWQPPVLAGGPAIRDISGTSRIMGEGNGNLVYPSPWDFKRSLTCRKILRHGTSGFTSHPKEGVLWIIIALKNPSPWPGFNPQPLGLVASTLTTTPPRRPIVEGLSFLV